MIGTIANTATILAGSIIGSTLRKGIGEKYKSALMDAMGLAATALGINSIVQAMPQSKYHVLFIVSLALGGVIGTRLSLDTAFERAVPIFPGAPIWPGDCPPLFCSTRRHPFHSRAYPERPPGGSYLSVHQRHSGRYHFHRPLLHLRHRHRPGGGGSVLLAGSHLPAGGADRPFCYRHTDD